MFLFNKKTRNAIKYIWGTLASLVVISMIITYSGFSTLARTQNTQQEQIEIPPEIQAQLQNQKDGEPIDLSDGENSYEKQQVLKAIEEGRLDINPEGTSTEATTQTQEQTPPPSNLKLEI